jgi:cysteinyl-tRNA synthetase
MSKSLGNVYNLQDIIDQGFRPSALRYLYLGVHYRKQLRFSWSAMEQAEESLRRLTDFLARVDALPARPVHATIPARLAEAEKEFGVHIAADLNTSGALSVLFDLVRELNTAMDAGELGAADAPAIRATFAQFDQVLGVLALRKAEDEHPPVPVEEIERLIAARRDARLARNFAEADRIRKDLESRGIILEDTGSVTRWKKK